MVQCWEVVHCTSWCAIQCIAQQHDIGEDTAGASCSLLSSYNVHVHVKDSWYAGGAVLTVPCTSLTQLQLHAAPSRWLIGAVWQHFASYVVPHTVVVLVGMPCLDSWTVMLCLAICTPVKPNSQELCQALKMLHGVVPRAVLCHLL